MNKGFIIFSDNWSFTRCHRWSRRWRPPWRSWWRPPCWPPPSSRAPSAWSPASCDPPAGTDTDSSCNNSVMNQQRISSYRCVVVVELFALSSIKLYAKRVLTNWLLDQWLCPHWPDVDTLEAVPPAGLVPPGSVQHHPALLLAVHIHLPVHQQFVIPETSSLSSSSFLKHHHYHHHPWTEMMRRG